MHVSHTYFKAQLDKHNATSWQLEELLHVHEATLHSTVGGSACHADDQMSSSVTQKSTAPTLLDILAETGLPDWIPGPTQKAIFKKMRAMTGGDEPLLVWKEPLQVQASLKFTLRDSQTVAEDPSSTQTVIFRAAKHYQGVPSQDCIKVLIESDTDKSAIYFAQCMSFIKDSNDDYYVVVRWFERQELNGFDPISHVPSFKLELENRTDSYCVLPAYSILNGAVMVPGKDNKFWAVLSPNEEKAYARQFNRNT
jgi:hypothetical protein